MQFSLDDVLQVTSAWGGPLRGESSTLPLGTHPPDLSIRDDLLSIMLLRFYGGPSPVPAVTARVIMMYLIRVSLNILQVPKCRCKSVTAEYVFRRTAELYIVQSHPSVAMISTTLVCTRVCVHSGYSTYGFGV